MGAFNWSPGGCCCVLVGPWDQYRAAWDANFDSTPNTNEGGPDLVRTAMIYLQDDPPDNIIYDIDSLGEDANSWYVTIPDTGDGRSFQHQVPIYSICPLGIGSELVYYFDDDGGTHYSQITFRFIEDTDGFADHGDEANVTFEWHSSECVRFRDTAVEGGTFTETARWAGAWDDLILGDASISAVVSVELVSLRRKVESVTENLTSHALAIRVYADDDTLLATVYNATLPTSAGSYATATGDGPHTIDLSYDDAWTNIYIEIEYTYTTTSAGSTAQEVRLDDLVFEIKHSGTNYRGQTCMDAINETIEWIVPDWRWYDLEYTDSLGDRHEGAVPIAGLKMWQLSELGYFEADEQVYDQSGNCCHANGRTQWGWLTFNGYTAFNVWTISDSGGYDYELIRVVEDWTLNDVDAADWIAAGIVDKPVNYDLATYTWLDPPSDDMTPADKNGKYKPIYQSSQSKIALGYRCTPTTVGAVPGGLDPTWEDAMHNKDYATWISPNAPFDCVLHLAFGEVLYDVEDDYGAPTVDATYSWNSPTYEQYTTLNIDMACDSFDASPSCAIAAIRYRHNSDHAYVEDFLDVPQYEVTEQTEVGVLLINGSEEEGPSTVFVHDIDGSTYPTDNRAYWPRWINVRALQPDGTCAYFRRYPYDSSQESGDDTLREWELHHLGSGGDWNLMSCWGYEGQAYGSVTFNTATPAVCEFTARRGGDADGTVANGAFTVVVNDGTPEDAEYDSGTNTLTVTIDITGGHDTIEDLRAVINAAGDFKCLETYGDSDTITATTEGDTGATDMAGGTDTPYSPTAVEETPYVLDSSDRYFYLLNFPIRVRELIDGRWTALRAGPSELDWFPLHWQISHNGLLKNPLGSGTDRSQRTNESHSYGSFDFSTIKHSELTLTPELGKR